MADASWITIGAVSLIVAALVVCLVRLSRVVQDGWLLLFVLVFVTWMAALLWSMIGWTR